MWSKRKGTPTGCEIIRGGEVHIGKKDSVPEVHPSAIMDLVAKNNHTIDWEGMKFPSRDSDTTKRGI